MTNGAGVNVVYESVGSTLVESFNATKIGGTVVFYGMAGGNPIPVDPRMLMDTSKTLTVETFGTCLHLMKREKNAPLNYSNGLRPEN